MPLLESLSELLPSRWAKAVALSTLPAALAAFSAPHFLSPLAKSMTNAEVILAQIISFLLVFSLGAVATLALVLLHSRQQPQASSDPELYKRLAEHHRVIVAISRITRPTVAKIAIETSLSQESVVHYIEFMRGHKYIALAEPLALTEEGHRAVLQL